MARRADGSPSKRELAEQLHLAVLIRVPFLVSGPGLTLRQMWRLLGNSLNVLVVSRIMIQLLQKEGSTCEQSTACATE